MCVDSIVQLLAARAQGAGAPGASCLTLGSKPRGGAAVWDHGMRCSESFVPAQVIIDHFYNDVPLFSEKWSYEPGTGCL